jgi:hypothetical protein
MNYTGLFSRFMVNRPLNSLEISRHLAPKEPSTAEEPRDHNAVIRINSTYLECIDTDYSWTGICTVIATVLAVPFLWGMISTLFLSVQKRMTLSGNDRLEETMFIIGVLVIMILFLWLFYYLFSKELFCYTHYPIRFNRKTRMVHVFRTDGTVMSEPWDKLYFTVGSYAEDYWGILAHRLAEDNVTVLETFALPHQESEISPELFEQWEFICRYMEEGPKKLIDQITGTMNIAKRKETFWFGFYRMMMSFDTLSVFAWLCSPFTLICAIGRWIAMKTDKIPVWPAEIEAECQIDPNDPHQRDEQHPHPSQKVHRGGATA